MSILDLEFRYKTFDVEAAQQASQRLEQFSTQARFHSQALRVLTLGAAFLHTNDLSNALHYSSQLIADPLATFQDRLVHLSLLHGVKSQRVTNYLEGLQQESEQKLDQVYPVVAWMIGHGQLAQAQDWLNHLPAQSRHTLPVLMAMVELLAAKKDWPLLEAMLQDQQWGRADYARLGVLARVAHERKEKPLRQAYWDSAVRAAGGRLFDLQVLLDIARSCQWANDEETLLLQITQRFPREQWALKDLERVWFERANTRGLQELYSMMLEHDKTNAVIKNNLALTSFLLNINLPRAHQLAKEAYAQRTNDCSAASTYAYSLHLLGQTSNALAILETFPPKQLEKPSIAAYYGALLAAAHQTDKAKKYLNLSAQAKLLPEEQTLVRNTLRSL